MSAWVLKISCEKFKENFKTIIKLVQNILELVVKLVYVRKTTAVLISPHTIETSKILFLTMAGSVFEYR